MTLSKRLFDVFGAAAGLVILAPLMGVIALAILLIDGRPVLYLAERMQTPTRAFRLIKFRTMRVAPQDSGVTGGDKAGRITRLGAFLRRMHFDELPQIWNVLIGDISFVGPRPPLRQYVERFPDLYAQVLRARPGIAGLASVYFSAHERRLLARCTTPEQTEEIYCRICIPRKARLDLIYQRRRSMCYDWRLMLIPVFHRLR